ncbi:MAG: box helicase, partial [Candidatus Hydrogenedentes bacterium]|nr:box helicase [Candidatus Hydrogenedentota bacterium]
VAAFVERDEACLVFVKAKHESRKGAELLAGRVRHPAADRAIEALRKLEPTRSRDGLLNTLTNAVAFHNADLSPEEREIVEQAFRAGEIKVVVSTSTLAVGLNMPARNVFVAAEKWRCDDRFGMPWKTPILHAEYENMGGRAGRYGAGYPFGRAILIAATPFDQETLWRRYIEGQREKIEPQLARDGLENPVLRLVASRMCRTEETLLSFIECTLTGQWIWRETLTAEECAFRVHAAVNRAVDAGMLARHPDGRLEATPLGQAVASKGISIDTARELEHWIGVSETRRWSALNLMLAAALTADGRMLQVMLTAREYDHADYPGRLKRAAEGEDIGADVPLNRIRNSNLMPFFEEVRAIKVALMLSDWIEHAPLCGIEEAYHTMAGQVLGAADQLSWLIDATAAIARALGANEAFIGQIETLGERVQRGLREETLPLARTCGALTRNGTLALVAHGLHTAEALDRAPLQAIAMWVPPAQARVLKDWGRRQSALAEGNATAPTAAPTAVPVLIVDDRRPGEIVLDGERIALQEKQYQLIRTLATAPGECVSYDTIYEALWGQHIVEPNQMHFQKRKLLTAILERVPHRGDLVKTVPKHGFELNLLPAEVLLPAATLARVN